MARPRNANRWATQRYREGGFTRPHLVPMPHEFGSGNDHPKTDAVFRHRHDRDVDRLVSFRVLSRGVLDARRLLRTIGEDVHIERVGPASRRAFQLLTGEV